MGKLSRHPPRRELGEKSHVQQTSKTASINATINGHALSVVFTENLGTVHVEVTDTSGGFVDLTDMYTPNGYNANLPAGLYTVKVTLSDGKSYSDTVIKK